MIKNILIIDDEPEICNLLSKFLSKNGYETKSVPSGKEALKLLKQKDFKLALCDYNLGDMNGHDLYEEIHKINPEMITIFISGAGSIQTAVGLMKKGAYDFLTKPLYPDQILTVVKNAFSDILSRKNNDEKESSFYVKGESRASKTLFKHVELVAPTDYCVIIQGETGTGKEALSRFLHQGSIRCDGPFVAIDCGSLSKELAASELFGHEKGAFTGAQQSKEGAFELANGGTLFLDEIGNLSYEVQMYLLRVLQEKKVRRVGGVKEKDVDARIIVATNEDLKDLVDKKQFREDLFHRLNEFKLEVPPLRERMEDLPLFVDKFVLQACDKLGREIKGISDNVWKIFKSYNWPGNIRELQNVIKRACLLTPYQSEIDEHTLPLELQSSFKEDNFIDNISGSDSLKVLTLEVERDEILRVLEKTKNNKTKAAALLNIDRKTLYNKLKRFELDI